MSANKTPAVLMTTDQKLIVVILAFLQFTTIVDFMILAPLGAILLEELHIDTKQFGLVVSAYAFAAGAASFLAAGFADRFDRKTLLLFFYTGFIVGTALCGVAPSFELLLAARVVTGVFSGVIGSIVMAIVADVFPLSMRGRVMGTLVSALSAAQIVGLPAGLALSNAWGWHAPFVAIAGLGTVVGVAIALVLKPIDAHLSTLAPAERNPFAHIARIAARPAYVRVFVTTVLLAAGFMVNPLLTPFFVNNLHVDIVLLPLLFMITGGCTFFVGPLVGKLADSVGKLVVFTAGSLLASVLFVAFAQLSGPTPLWSVIAINVALFAANAARMIAAGAINSAVPAPADRGAFMSINTSLQQLAAGAVTALGGAIVFVRSDGTLGRFDTLCYVVVGAIVVAVAPVWLIDRAVKAQRPS